MLAILAAIAIIQLPTNNPVVEASQRVGQTGLSTAAAPAKSPTAFKPSGARIYVSRFVKEMFDAADERSAMEPLLKQVLDNYDVEAKKGGFANDSSASIAFAATTLFGLAKGQEIDDAAIYSLSERLRSTLDTPAVRGATDLQKQEASEWAICSAGYILIVASMAESEDAKRKVAQLANLQLTALLGVGADQMTLEGKVFRIKATPKPKPADPEPPANAGGLAPGFSFSPPSDWTKEAVWYAFRHRPDPNSGITSALVRFLPAIPMKGSLSDILRKTWKEAVPPELANAASNMVFRRYIGNGAIAHFIFGRGLETGHQADTLFTVYLVDCGTYWQPVVVAQTYEDPTFNVVSAVQMSAGFSYSQSAAFAEVFLARLKSPAKPGQAIADPKSLIGSYKFGSGANLQWENIYTGASSMTFVSYGGTMDLKADGSFSYTFSSASGQVGATTFRGAKGAGTWKVEGDQLITTFKTYDQGDGHFVKEHRYRIAGVIIFSDGVKVCVFKDELKDPINATNVGDSSDYFTTKKG